ncbi:MAG: MaoC family dehydratase N-terminal domain-containing protein [Actinomycetota bacterium]|nr:MaoC family dehydratase N-terminal domain-containing protein [Actinomycetota bacterium]
MDPAAEGTRYPDVTFEVSPERVAAFRQVFGQSHGVPPTFATAAEFAVFPFVIGDPGLALDFTRVIHSGQEYAYRRPLVEGETLTVRARIESIRVKGGNGFLTVATDLVGADGRVAVTARSTMIERGGE